MERRNLYTKQPYEEFDLDLPFAGPLTEKPAGASSLASSSLSAVKWPRKQPDSKSDAIDEILADDEGEILEPAKTKLRIHIQGGTDGFDYQITAKVVFDNGAKKEKEIFVRVREE